MLKIDGILHVIISSIPHCFIAKKDEKESFSDDLFTKRFKSPKTTATVNADVNSSTITPVIRCEIIITKTDVTSSRMMSFIYLFQKFTGFFKK